MANYIKVKLLATVIEGREESYKRLESAYYGEELDCILDRSNYYAWIDEEDEAWFNNGQIYINFLVKSNNFIIEYVMDFLNDIGFEDFSLECVFSNEDEINCETYESSEDFRLYSIGYFRETKFIDEYGDLDWDKVEVYPSTDWEKHEMFDLAWFGFRAPHNSKENFFDQLDLHKTYEGQPISPHLTGFRQRLGVCDYYVPITFFAYEDGEMKEVEHQLFLLEEVELPITKESIANDIIGNINMEQVYLKFKDYDLISIGVNHFEGFNEDTCLLYEKGYYSWSDDLTLYDNTHYDYRKKE